jgi:hypothetical protein
MSGPFSLHVRPGQPMQFPVDQRDYLVKSRLIAVASSQEQLCDFFGRGCRHSASDQARDSRKTPMLWTSCPSLTSIRTGANKMPNGGRQRENWRSLAANRVGSYMLNRHGDDVWSQIRLALFIYSRIHGERLGVPSQLRFDAVCFSLEIWMLSGNRGVAGDFGAR